MQLRSQTVGLTESNGAYVFTIDEKEVVHYQYDEIDPPAGYSELYKRGGFIHPVKTLDGLILTEIHPEDHVHHFGIWNPWTRVEFEGDTIDFWNLDEGQGTVRPDEIIKTTVEKESALLQVRLEHIVFDDHDEVVALDEIQEIKVSRIDSMNYIIDFTSTYSCASNPPFHILQYRYAGLGFRATSQWTTSNSEILTSADKTRKDADGSRADWVMAQGTFGDTHGGILIMSHPDNYNHPQPLRIWPTDMDGHDNVFINYAPTKTTDWLMEPGETYVLKYRFVVFDGIFNENLVNQTWKD